MVHVGGICTGGDGLDRIVGSLGCFRLYGDVQGNEGAKNFINGVVDRREKNRKAGKGTAARIYVEKRGNTDWRWAVDSNGNKTN